MKAGVSLPKSKEPGSAPASPVSSGSSWAEIRACSRWAVSLARAAADIHLNEVISVLDDESVETHCKSYAGVLASCVHTGDCGIRPVIVELHQIVDNALSDITLSQLLGTEAKVDAVLHKIQRQKMETSRVQA